MTEQLKAKSEGGERYYVREEIAAALKRDIVVIPVRVGREGQLPALPRASDLPPEIRNLVLYQKHDVPHENFGRDIAALIAAIQPSANRGSRDARRLDGHKIAGGVLAVATVAAIVALFWGLPISWH